MRSPRFIRPGLLFALLGMARRPAPRAARLVWAPVGETGHLVATVLGHTYWLHVSHQPPRYRTVFLGDDIYVGDSAPAAKQAALDHLNLQLSEDLT